MGGSPFSGDIGGLLSSVINPSVINCVGFSGNGFSVGGLSVAGKPGNGSADSDDVSAIYATVLGKNGALDESDTLIMALADVYGDGKITTADVALLNAARLGKTELEW